MRSSWIVQVGPKPKTHRGPCKDRGGYWGDAGTSQGVPRIFLEPSGAERGKEDFFPGASRGNVALPTP